MIKNNLFADLPADVPSELFETLFKTKACVLERIISQGQVTPPGDWLKQERDEWVVLLAGGARLSFENDGEVRLDPGDYVFIPAGTGHRVDWTEPDSRSVWLALHAEPQPVKKEAETGISRVKVIRSSRRKKTAGARLYGGTLYIYVPKNIRENELRRMIERFTARFEKVLLKKQLNSAKSLRQVAEELNAKYFGGSLKIDSIQYVTDQTSKFGYCNIASRSIRISHTLAEMPDWVRDYVIVHELAHLREPGHDKAFWELVRRYPLAERAKGFLMAKGLEPDEE